MDKAQKLSSPAVEHTGMVNREYTPSEKEEAVIDVLRDEWRANPKLIQEETGLGKGDINTALTNLRAAGWVTRVTRGLYEFVEDPREGGGRDRDDKRGGSGDATSDDLRRLLDGIDFKRNLSPDRRAVLAEFLEWVRDRDGGVTKSDAEKEFWREDLVERSGYNWSSFWEAFAKAALKQLDAVEQPNARTYRWRQS